MSTAIAPPTLDKLATRINAEHHACENAARSAVLHAHNVGRMLLQAKSEMSHGKWRTWMADHLKFSERTAQRYMLIGEHLTHEEIEEATRVSDLSTRAAIEMVRDKQKPDRDKDMPFELLHELDVWGKMMQKRYAEFPDRWKEEFLAGTEDFVMLARKYPDTFGASKATAVA